MFGAIVGDIIGSPYEFEGTKTTEFPLFTKHNRFTDDSVLTVAVADGLLGGGEYVDLLRTYGRRYPRAGYGGRFDRWVRQKHREPYNSWGNGSAMRVSAVAWARDTLEEVLEEAERSAAATHNHPEGIKGAQATAAAVFMARTGADKAEIKREIVRRFGYDLDRTVESIRPGYEFDVSCQGSVPEAIVAFLDSDDYEHAVRLAVSLGGDADTQACITGGIAEAFYGGVPEPIAHEAWKILDDHLRTVAREFHARFDGATTLPPPASQIR